MARRQSERPRRHTPGPIRFLTRIISAALLITLVIIFLPRLTRLVGRLWPDPARTTRVSEIIRHELQSTARLEVLTVDDQGVLTSTVQAALIGEVQRVTIEYDYHASIGVDLNQVQVETDGGTISVILPEMEILSDSLTPTKVDRQDFWYPLTEKRRNQLLEEEKEKRNSAALADANSPEIQKEVMETLEKLIQNWIGSDTWLTTIEIK